MRPFATAVLALALLPAAAGAEAWNRTFPAGKHPTVRITTNDARVDVKARPGTTVDARVRTSGSVTGLYVGRLTPRVRMEENGGIIEIEAKLVGTTAGISISSMRLEVDVDVPPGCDLDIQTSDGNSTVEGLEGNVSVSSSDGRVTLRDLKGDVRVRTSDGSLFAEGLDGTLTGRTSDGHMQVSGRFDDLTLESQDGRIELAVEKGSHIGEPWMIETADGGLDMTIPGNLRATLDARVSDGSLQLDLPAQRWEGSSARAVRIDLNGGGPVLRVRSSDGGVRIRSAS